MRIVLTKTRNHLMNIIEESKNCVNKYNLLFIILITSLILRMTFRSNYADDWDSVQFLLGMDNYSILAHQPHPPGYPVYITIGRIFNLLFDDSVASFTFISALFGTSSLIPTYFLANQFFGKRVGLLAITLLSLSPAHLLASEVVMSDIVSMCFITTTVLLLYKGIRSNNLYYAGSLLTGLTIGIRQTDFLLIIIYLIVTFYKREIKVAAHSAIILLTSFLSWFVPLIFYTGLNNFRIAYELHSQSAFRNATINLIGGPTLHNILITIKSLLSLFIEGWSFSFVFLAIVVIISIKYKIKFYEKYYLNIKNIILIAWLIPYLILFIFTYFLYYPRYLLPVFPPLAIIFAHSMVSLLDIAGTRSWKKILRSVYLLLIIFMGFQAITLAYTLHTTEPAPINAANFIKNNYNTNTTIIVVGDSFRHFQYYLPNYTVRFDIFTTPVEIYNYLIKNKTIISERDPFVMSSSQHELASFNRLHEIYPKHENIILYENSYSPTSDYLIVKDSGWHNVENWNGDFVRWMSNDSSIIINSKLNKRFKLSMDAISFNRSRILKIYVNDELNADATTTVSSSKFAAIETPLNLTKGKNVVKFHVEEGCERPLDKPELNNPDQRCLALAIRNLSLSN